MKIPSRLLPIAVMILTPALVRLMPYILGALGMQDVRDVAVFLQNYSPFHALLLLGAARFAERRWAYLVPLASMLISDVGTGLLTGDMHNAFHPTLPVVYGAYILFAWLGTFLRERRGAIAGTALGNNRWSLWAACRRVLAIAGTALACECAFFVVTNFAEWLNPVNAYPQTIAGLLQCYAMAIPFLNTRLISMAVFAPVLFGGVAFIDWRFGAATKPAPAEMPQSQQTAAA